MRNLVKSMLLAALLVAGVSCEKQFEEAVEVQSENHAAADVVTSYEVSYEEALAKADALFAGIDGATTRAGNRRVKNHELFRSGNRFTRTASDDVEAKFHIINYEDNAGFAMIAADKRATDIYAYSDTGNLYVDDAMKNSGFGVFLEGAVTLYQNEVNLNSLGLKDSLPFIQRPDIEYGDVFTLPLVELSGTSYFVRYGEYQTSSSVQPMVMASWNQWHPYNYYCPSCSWDSENEKYYKGKCAAGCGPIAAAQIMSYHKYPASYAGYEFDWTKMLQDYYFDYTVDADENSKMVARLIREIGRVGNANYGNKTSMSVTNTKKVFSTFGYNFTGAVDYDVNKVKTSINNNRPVYAVGYKTYGGGHAWVIDGYDVKEKEDIYYDTFAPYLVAFKRTFVNHYVHCNWGWGGDGRNENSIYPDKGYFLNDAFIVTVGYGDKQEERAYVKNREIIYNIYPKQ